MYFLCPPGGILRIKSSRKTAMTTHLPSTHGLQLLWPNPRHWRVDAWEAMWAVNLKIHACQTPQQDEKITRGLAREKTELLLFRDYLTFKKSRGWEYSSAGREHRLQVPSSAQGREAGGRETEGTGWRDRTTKLPVSPAPADPVSSASPRG